MTGGPQSAPHLVAGSTQQVAAEVKQLVATGDAAAAREAFGAIVEVLQRRANRLALYYLRNVADADEAVQDAFVKAYLHLDSYNPALSFDVWFLRILVNGCLDRVKSRTRRARWMIDVGEVGTPGTAERPDPPATEATPEEALLRAERADTLARAIATLPDRQRTVVLLSQLDGRSTREVSEITGLNESTVRVHLFRALRRLRRVIVPPAGDAAGGNTR